MHFRITVFTLFLFFSLADSKEIQTISTPEELSVYILNNVTEKTLLVLDIDDTLLISENPLLRAHVFDVFLKEVAHYFRLTSEEALSLVEIFLESSSSPLGRGSLLSQEFPPLIQTCFERSAKVIALTKVETGRKRIHIPHLGIDHIQKIAGEDRRFEDLKQVGLNFENSFLKEIGLETLPLSEYPFTCSLNKFPIYKRGILLTNLHPKGEVLAAFLDAIPWKPTKVIFADNILENVRSVKKEIKNKMIHFEGIYFNYVEQNLCDIDPKIFRTQLDFFLIHKKWREE